ncbi:MAG: Na/Pi cotransporter family protein [Ruminococcus sp.]|nr:Na/Pi cotransporter family protein [Ruminococcus sp.]
METFDIFSVFTMLGGLAFFLYGMNVMSSSLEKLTGGRLESALRKITSSKLKSLLLGMGITIAIQSSSAVTVMLVGLVNSGIMQLEQTVAVCFGADIGTTLTAWILSLSGIKGDNFFLKLLKPSSFSPLVALAGIMLIMLSKKSKKKDIGSIMLGFSILMTGMMLMSGAVEPLAESESFQSMLVAFKNPLLGVLVGAAFTGVIQSSAASIGIMQAFSSTGALTVGMAAPLIMGLNIGTCVTALISSIGVKKNAKRVATIHILIKLIGVCIVLPVTLLLEATVAKDFFNETITPVGIAIGHSIFNIVITLILMPFSNQLVKLSTKIVRDKEEEAPAEDEPQLDMNLFKIPSVAVEACRGAAIQMARHTEDTICDALYVLQKYDEKLSDKVIAGEQLIDRYEDRLGSYLVKISKASVSSADNRKVSKMMHIIGNLERISDHAVNLIESAKELKDKDYHFSEDGSLEMNVICAAIDENIHTAIRAYIDDDLALAHRVEPLEEVVDKLIIELKNRHIDRLQAGQCTVELGYIFQDILINLERISDHCSNIAGCIIEIEEKTEIHGYWNEVKENDETFRRLYKDFSTAYFSMLPKLSQSSAQAQNS